MLDELTIRVRELVATKQPVGYDVKIDLAEHGYIFAVATQAPIVVSNDGEGASVTLHMSATDLKSVLDGELNVTSAYMFGKIRIDGDLSKAMLLASLFS
ncbi:sterol-binding protein [Gammaproteobacteria bacterium]|jgi:putative sterol carrier protein|nr:sterol-binding protein [Gammaproteobacteria bacterium]